MVAGHMSEHTLYLKSSREDHHIFFSWRRMFGLVSILGDFRFEYEYEIEYENDFSILVCRLHIVTSHTYLIPWATLST